MRLKFRSIAWLFGVALLVLPILGVANEADLVVERAWLEDSSGQLSWNEVRKRSMTPFEGVLSLGYGDKPVWIRLRIDPALAKVASIQQIYLRIRPLYLDEIIVYDTLQDSPRLPPLGDLYPVSAQSEPSNTFLYRLPLGNAPREIWLRVKTTSTRLIYPEVMTLTELRLSESRINLFGAGYLGLIGIFFLWGIVQLTVQPDRLMIAFLFHQGAAFTMGASFLGYFYLYLSDYMPFGWIDKITSTAVIVTSVAAVVFSHYLLKELGPARWRSIAIGLIILIYPLLLYAIWNGQVIATLTFNTLLVFLLPFILWAFAFISKPVSTEVAATGLSRPVVLGYFSITMVFTLTSSLSALGLVKAGVFSLYIVFMYSISSGILMLLLLQYRSWLNIRRQSLMLAMAQEAQVRAEEEKAQREERERLLAMLGHELKTPIAAIRMMMADRTLPAEVTKRIDVSVTDMAHVVERAVQSGQLETGRITLDLQMGNLLEFTRSLCNALPEGERVDIESVGNPQSAIYTDLELLKVVLRNLVDNALKYSPPEDRVRVFLSQPDAQGNWSVVVSNPAGRAGLPDSERIFEKYYRNPKATYRSGSGLGLYLVHGLIKVMGGSLRYELKGESVNFILTMQNQKTESNA